MKLREELKPNNAKWQDGMTKRTDNERPDKMGKAVTNVTSRYWYPSLICTVIRLQKTQYLAWDSICKEGGYGELRKKWLCKNLISLRFIGVYLTAWTIRTWINVSYDYNLQLVVKGITKDRQASNWVSELLMWNVTAVFRGLSMRIISNVLAI